MTGYSEVSANNTLTMFWSGRIERRGANGGFVYSGLNEGPATPCESDAGRRRPDRHRLAATAPADRGASHLIWTLGGYRSMP